MCLAPALYMLSGFRTLIKIQLTFRPHLGSFRTKIMPRDSQLVCHTKGRTGTTCASWHRALTPLGYLHLAVCGRGGAIALMLPENERNRTAREKPLRPILETMTWSSLLLQKYGKGSISFYRRKNMTETILIHSYASARCVQCGERASPPVHKIFAWEEIIFRS